MIMLDPNKYRMKFSNEEIDYFNLLPKKFFVLELFSGDGSNIFFLKELLKDKQGFILFVIIKY